MNDLIRVENLTLRFDTDEGRITAVEDISFSLKPGEVLGLVGESGSGKSVTAKSIMKLNPANATYGRNTKMILQLDHGQVDIMSLRNAKEMQIVRGGAVSMIFQEPMASFAPAITIGDQMVEQLRIHTAMSVAECRDLSIMMLERVGISDASKRFSQYAFELSGGMRQRAMIANGPVHKAQTPNCRRADHGIGCHHSSASSRPNEGFGERIRNGDYLHHARSRRGCANGGQHRRNVSWQGG